MTKIAVLGGGSWGTALANVAAENNNDVRLWTRTATQADEINSQHTNQKYLPDAKLSSELMATSN
ncbi:glycerol-3-phosphate dehydrogenase, partial [Leuconostoc pseudomesenteroides]